MFKKISRREMLKGLGVGMAAAVVASCTPEAPKPTEAKPAATQPAAPATKAPAAEVVSIRFAGWGNAEELKLYDDIAKAHMEANPKIKIETMGMPSNDYAQKIFTWIASGDPPENLRTGTQYFPTLHADGALLDLTAYFKAAPALMDKNLYFTDLYSIYTVDGKMYGTVLGPNVVAGFYNVDLFQKAKIDPPNEYWTVEQYVDAAKKLTQGEGPTKVWGSSLSFRDRQCWQALVWSQGGEMFDKVEYPTKCLLNSPEAINAFQWMQDMVYKHKAAPTAAEFSAIQGGFNSGLIGMELQGTWEVNARRKITAFKWDLFPVPKAIKRITTYLAGAVVIPKATKKADAAWAHAAYIQSDKAQELIAKDSLNTPMNRKIASSDTFLKVQGAPANHMVRVQGMDYARNRDFYFAKWSEVQSKVWGPEIENLMLNKQSATETAKKMADGTQPLL
jgi:multiple sugar transport system substrate-binding protein